MCQSDVLSRFVEETYHFSDLAGHSPHAQSLSPADEEMLWSLVDYSTLSNEAAAFRPTSESPDSAFWADMNTSWYDLFGGTHMADFGATVNGDLAPERDSMTIDSSVQTTAAPSTEREGADPSERLNSLLWPH